MTARCILVVIASEHNVAEAQSVLALAPQHVVVVASSHRTILPRAQRLAAWVEHNQRGTSASVICASMQGDAYEETVQCLHAELTTELARLRLLHPNAPIWLNITGGTKSTAIALLRHADWDAVVYKSLSDGRLQRIAGDAHQLDLPRLPTLSPVQHLTLYAELKLGEAQRSLPTPDKRAAAECVWRASQVADSPWCQLASHPVGERFFARAAPEAGDAEGIPWTELPGLREWWRDNLQVVAPQDDHALVLPFEGIGKSRTERERTQRLNRWLRGSWLEDAAVAWLLRLGIAPSQIDVGRNVTPLQSSKEMAGSNELDVVVAHNDRLWVIECKYSVDKSKVQDYANQLGNQMAVVGRPNAALLLASPPRDALLAAAATRGFRVLCGPDQLARWLGLLPAAT